MFKTFHKSLKSPLVQENNIRGNVDKLLRPQPKSIKVKKGEITLVDLVLEIRLAKYGYRKRYVE